MGACECQSGLTSPTQLAAVWAAVQVDDLDAALNAGLMEVACCMDALLRAGASPQMAERLWAAAEERREAWAARRRYLARNARNAKRQAARAAAREQQAKAPAALPDSARAALERALARARSAKP